MNDAVRLSPLDHHFAEFINRIDHAPCDELRLAAALVSAATQQGSTCLNLGEIAGTAVIISPLPAGPVYAPATGPWRMVLKNCSTVGRPGEYTPLILDDADRLYLHRSWDYERRTADGILARLASPSPVPPPFAAGLDHLFPPQSGSPDWQRKAAVAALSRHLTVITGGPGTGKTTTVARILALLIEQAEGTELRIYLAAPTGKAAMKLGQSILHAVQQLDISNEVRALIPNRVRTIHRLLGVLPGATGFRHNRENLLPCDVLVVDEVSMIDLPLMARMLEALPPAARLILLGDHNQLSSVEAGAVLADICNHGDTPRFSAPPGTLPEQQYTLFPPENAASSRTPLADCIIHLHTSYRFSADSGIGELSRLINAGEGAAALKLLQSGAYSDLAWRQLPTGADFTAAFARAMQEGYGSYLRSATPEEALRELDRFRVLSPHREGVHGAGNLNLLTEAALGLRRSDGLPWSRMLPLMVTGNNYELGLFNGDTAVVMEGGTDNRLTAFFPTPDGGARQISPLRLPPCDPAFALTVHKSQGSEFDRLLLILPDQMSEALSRQLLYTAVTRARSRIEIWGTEETFCSTVQKRIMRSSGLRDRLWRNDSSLIH